MKGYQVEECDWVAKLMSWLDECGGCSMGWVWWRDGVQVLSQGLCG